MAFRGQKSAEHDELLRLWLSSRGHDDRPQAVVLHHTAFALYELAEFIPTTIHTTVPTAFRKVVPKGCLLPRGLVPACDAQGTHWSHGSRRASVGTTVVHEWYSSEGTYAVLSSDCQTRRPRPRPKPQRAQHWWGHHAAAQQSKPREQPRSWR
jgi:hypothetical protein